MIDSHCHLDHEPLFNNLDDILKRSKSVGIEKLLTICTTLKSFEKIKQLVIRDDIIYGTYGIHPHEAKNDKVTTDYILTQINNNSKIIGIGETGLDFYYNQNLDTHLEQWFASESLSQVPPYVTSCVPRFARARMMLYKEPPKRFIGGERNKMYDDISFKLDSKTKEFAELSWLLGHCWMKSKYNERKQRLEYEVLPMVQEYYHTSDSEPYGYSYEIESPDNHKRFVFWIWK